MGYDGRSVSLGTIPKTKLRLSSLGCSPQCFPQLPWVGWFQATRASRKRLLQPITTILVLAWVLPILRDSQTALWARFLGGQAKPAFELHLDSTTLRWKI